MIRTFFLLSIILHSKWKGESMSIETTIEKLLNVNQRNEYGMGQKGEPNTKIVVAV